MTTTKKPAKAAKKAAPSAGDKIALSPAEQADRDAEKLSTELAEFQATITQREWILVTNKLDRSREQITADGSLRLLALAWIREKREHGGASWDRLLDLTDAELLELHGYDVRVYEDDAELEGDQEPAGEAEGDQGA